LKFNIYLITKDYINYRKLGKKNLQKFEKRIHMANDTVTVSEVDYSGLYLLLLGINSARDRVYFLLSSKLQSKQNKGKIDSITCRVDI
jgi:hypothetical protein